MYNSAEPITYTDLLKEKPALADYNACYSLNLQAVNSSVKYYVIRSQKKNEIAAALCLQSEKRKGIIHISNPAYFQNIGLWIKHGVQNNYESNSISKKILGQIAEFLDKYKWVNVSLPDDVKDGLEFYWRGFSLMTRYTYKLDLSNFDALGENMSKGLKGDLRKVEKSEISYSSEPSTQFKEVLKKFSADHRSANEALIWETLYDSLLEGGKSHLTGASYENNRGAALMLYVGKTAIYIFGGSDKVEGVPLGTAALWSSICHARERGIQYIDFEGSMLKGVERYFRSFGGELAPYLNITKEPSLISMAKLIKS